MKIVENVSNVNLYEDIKDENLPSPEGAHFACAICGRKMEDHVKYDICYQAKTNYP